MGMQMVGCCPCTSRCQTQGLGLPWLPRPPGPASPTPPGREQELTPPLYRNASAQVRGLLRGQAAPWGRCPISEDTGLFQPELSSCNAQLGRSAEDFN